MTRVSETAASVDSQCLAGAPLSMDMISALLPPIKAEIQRSSTSAPSAPESNLKKQEQPDMANTMTVDLPPPSFINSIKELRTFSTALSTFLRRYDELHDHLNFIKTSIDSKLPNHLLHSANPNQRVTPLTQTSFADTITAVPETMATEQNPNGTATNCVRSHEIPDMSEKSEETDTLKKPEETDTFKKPDISKKPDVSELESCCVRMSGRDMRKYVIRHISDMDKLGEEIPRALKLAKDPAKLVLQSIGRFFLQGSKSYCKGSHLIAVRLASVMILECFVMISGDGIEITKEEAEYATNAAVSWRNRMIKNGGLAKMDEIDARGLLMLISGFGIPDPIFKNEDIRDLIRVSDVKKISSVLRHSNILMPKIPEVIDWMVKNNLEIEAADIAHNFGLEDKCRPSTKSQNGSSGQGDMGAKSGVSFNGTTTNGRRSRENVRKLESPDFVEKPEETETSKKPEETDNSKKAAVSELESYCEAMCGRDIRRYVIAHIHDMNKLREEIPKAIKLAENPAKLVLEAVGRFFSQGSRSFSEGSKMVVVRLAAVLILECFVMISSNGIEIAKEEEEYAAKAAVDWRKRMINEGGLAKTDEVDASGLLLLISGFGIPSVFKDEDIRDLIRATNVKKVSSALRRSIILIPKIPEVIDWMVKNDLEIEAADIAYTFGLEDKCRPQTILTTFLHNKITDRHHGSSSAQVNIKKQLSDLKSIRWCLETHNVDPPKPLADFKINERIQQLEKEINELESKPVEANPARKRKAKEPESSRNQKRREEKCSRLTSQEPKPVDYYGTSPYNRLTRSGNRNYFDGKLPNDYISSYPTSSVLHAPGLSENIESRGGLDSGGMLGGSFGSDLAIESRGGLAGGGMLTSSYGSGRYGGPYPDQMVNGRLYSWHEDSSLVERYLGQPSSRLGQTYDSQPSTTGLIGLYSRQSGRPSQEKFPGLPSSSSSPGFSSRAGPGSDLYGFADMVVQNESGRGSYALGSGTMRSPHLY